MMLKNRALKASPLIAVCCRHFVHSQQVLRDLVTILLSILLSLDGFSTTSRWFGWPHKTKMYFIPYWLNSHQLQGVLLVISKSKRKITNHTLVSKKQTTKCLTNLQLCQPPQNSPPKKICKKSKKNINGSLPSHLLKSWLQVIVQVTRRNKVANSWFTNSSLSSKYPDLGPLVAPVKMAGENGRQIEGNGWWGQRKRPNGMYT